MNVWIPIRYWLLVSVIIRRSLTLMTDLSLSVCHTLYFLCDNSVLQDHIFQNQKDMIEVKKR